MPLSPFCVCYVVLMILFFRVSHVAFCFPGCSWSAISILLSISSPELRALSRRVDLFRVYCAWLPAELINVAMLQTWCSLIASNGSTNLVHGMIKVLCFQYTDRSLCVGVLACEHLPSVPR
uniref:Uncharacterized protein n=1 Tax=Anopheles darlingi TaxID=43151 RepID=A0A2M4D325_ANODA